MIVSFCDWRRSLLSLIGVGLFVVSTAGQVPQTIAFQGLLTNEEGVVLASGDYSITFRLYNVETEGTALWTEVQSVQVVDGVANATLGRVNPLTLPFNVPYWLGITLQQEGSELVPRIALASGPYALMAKTVPDGAITAAKIADGAITTQKIQEGGLPGGAIADGAITPGKLADGAVTAVKISNDAIGSGAIIDGSITADDLAEEAVTAVAIGDGAVTRQKLSTSGASSGQALVYNGSTLIWGAPSGSGVISGVEAGAGLTGGGTEGMVTLSIAENSLTRDFIASNAIESSELAPNAVETGNIANQAVTRDKLDRSTAQSGDVLAFDGSNVVWAAVSIADGSVTTDKLAAGAVTATKIGTGAVTPEKVDHSTASAGDALTFDGSNVAWAATAIPDGGVTNAKLAPDAVTADKIEAGAVGSDEIGSQAVTTAKLADGSVAPTKISGSGASSDDVLRYSGSTVEWGPVSIPNGSVTEDKLANQAVTTNKLENSAVTTNKLNDNAVTAVKLNNSAVTTDKLNNSAVTTAKLDNSAVTTNKLADGSVTAAKISGSGASADEVLRYTGSAVEWGAVSVPDNSIDTDKLVDLAVATGKIANASVTSAKIAAQAVGTSQVSDGAITNSKIGGFLNLDKLSTVGADEGDVVTFTGGVVTWAPGTIVPATSGNVKIDGDLTVTGSVAKGGGTFMIDHPLDPTNRYLYHSFVESDEMMNVYTGNVTLSDDGGAWVELPDWFEALNKDFRYQLTCIGGYAPVFVAEPVADGRFRIDGGRPGLEVSWQITGVRNDPWAQKNRMRVEVDKEGTERGTLLHPEVYEQ